MKRLAFYYRMDLQFDAPVHDHDFALRYVPHSDSVQQITIAQKKVEPADWLQEETDAFGNHLYVGRCAGPHTFFMYEVSGTALVDAQKREKEPCRICYAYPSRLTGYDSQLTEFFRKIPLTDGSAFARACALMQYLYDHFRYERGATTIDTTAGEALKKGCGVCQDYAHILIALCRCAGIPARYVAGLQMGEGATHAWIEIYDGGFWRGLDPTHNRYIDDIYIKLSHGRDYQDCILDRGIFYGAVGQQQKIYAKVEELI